VTTIVAKLDPALAKRVARAADIVNLSHEQFCIEAIRLFVRSLDPEGYRLKRKTVRRRK
jgi:hypothetical protein